MYRERKTLTRHDQSTPPGPARNIGNQCAQEFDGWDCTREPGHTGPHVCHGHRPALAVWDDNRTTDTED